MTDGNEEDTTPRIAVLGAGPIGLEAALYGRFLGYEVDIFEQGEVCQNLLQLGHVRLFSPFLLNRSPLGVAAIRAQSPQRLLPAEDALLTGRELLEQYYRPLADSDLLVDHLRIETRVLSVTRAGPLKGELVGDDARGEFEFRILVQNKDASESIYLADVVLDTTGTYGQPNWMGQGGGPAIGERALRHPRQMGSVARGIEYGLPDILGADRDRYANSKTLVVGGGYSAATSVTALSELARQESETSVIWVTRTTKSEPIGRIEYDRLAERDRLAETANRLASNQDGSLRHIPGMYVERIEMSEATEGESQDKRSADDQNNEGSFRIELKSSDGAQSEILEVDQIIANVGYHPDGSIYDELQIQTCYATEGPMKLAVARAAIESGDCLDQNARGAATLTNPEPNFYILGSKSYGRASNFLLATGLEQIREVYTLIAEAADLNLYKSIQAQTPGS